MQVIVKPHSVEIKKEEVTNQGEYNIQSCEFQFSSEYDGLKKVAVFSKGSTTIDIDLIDDTCTIPYEMLENEGIVTLGVYGYEINGDDLVKRYSPTTDRFLVQSGSYKLGEEPTPPSPSIIEKLQADVQKNTDDINNLQEEQITQNTNIQNNTNAIETNTSDISDIKTEQTTQNTNIAKNTDDIATLNTNLTNYYTKQETDNLLDNKADIEDIPDLTDYVKNTDYATANKGGVIKSGGFGAFINNNGQIYGYAPSYNDYLNLSNTYIISKGTLENVITGKGLVSNTDYATDSVGGVIKTGNGIYLSGNTTIAGVPYSYGNYETKGNATVISKGTLENVLNARIGDIDTILTAITTGNGV